MNNKERPNFKTRRLLVWALLLILLLALAMEGCGGSKKPTPSGFYKKEASLNKKAKEAYANRRYNKALVLYKEALNASRAVEDIDLSAVNLINIAATYRALGQRDNAIRTVDEILEASHIKYPVARLSEAAFIKALLLKDAQDYTGARKMADKAMDFCLKANCGAQGKIFNLKARLAFLERDLPKTLALGQTGLKINRAQKNEQETANSLRLIADVKTEKAEYADARALYEEALVHDKELGLSKKIALDLRKIGVLLKKQGLSKEALKYFQRAYSVSLGGKDEAGVKLASEMINSLQTK
ncbi:MAG: tetratricopeptide repeat protein [Deltaproteobacteria bacterium]|nr:tetratricopeptide repeat protein [Deltaproteobacteria bacterium]